MGIAVKNFGQSMNGVKHLMEHMIPRTTTNAIAGLTRLPASVGLARTNPPHILCQLEVTQTMCFDMRVCLVCAHSTRTGVCICVSENLTSTQAINATIWWPQHRQPTQEELWASEVPPISNTKSDRVQKAHAYGERHPVTWMFFYWASNAECGPRRRKRSRLAAQRRPHRKSIECCHSGSRGKQKKQRTGTSSSSSAIAWIRGRACSPSVSLIQSLPPREASCGLSGHPGRIHFSSVNKFLSGAAVSTSFGGVPRPVTMLSGSGTDAPRNPCSVDAGETVLLHTPSPRRPTEPLEAGCRWRQISCTPALSHGKRRFPHRAVEWPTQSSPLSRMTPNGHRPFQSL
ncbi:hypothetical protein TCDM_13485 [Trypanosoma cruzi Dm28c]|uniref:Uncharacterized protein n=1 Tax=Trypanosoma cruzi Dm28c TaxID=1416333 RepID=V5A2R7_TRYCR|nr:hypothetical protein TCDM_13485 [Trypanosoma cruzi Dm28c]